MKLREKMAEEAWEKFLKERPASIDLLRLGFNAGLEAGIAIARKAAMEKVGRNFDAAMEVEG